MAIPFVRNFEFEYGRCDPLSPLVQRVIADNPGPFTYTGTGVYIIGNESACNTSSYGPLPARQTARGGTRL